MRIRPQSASKDIAVVSPQAVQQLFRVFRWGSNVEPLKEQIACLLGKLYRTPDKDERFIADIREVHELQAGYATENRLIVDQRMFEASNRLANEKGLSFLGFVHSHPGEQKVAMSLGDYQLHREMYNTDWTTALNIIVNPQRKLFSAYAGPCANHIELLLLGDTE